MNKSNRKWKALELDSEDTLKMTQWLIISVTECPDSLLCQQQTNSCLADLFVTSGLYPWVCFLPSADGRRRPPCASRWRETVRPCGGQSLTTTSSSPLCEETWTAWRRNSTSSRRITRRWDPPAAGTVETRNVVDECLLISVAALHAAKFGLVSNVLQGKAVLLEQAKKKPSSCAPEECHLKPQYSY